MKSTARNLENDTNHNDVNEVMSSDDFHQLFSEYELYKEKVR